MTPSEMLAARADCVKEIAQKTEALRHESEIEVFRYEGAVGALKQVADMARPVGKDPVVSDEMLQALDALSDQSKAELIAARGRVQQGEKLLDMLEAFYQADLTASQRLLEQAEPTKKDAPKRPKGRHPGASIKSKRLAEAAP